jgi:hypothetical protein
MRIPFVGSARRAAYRRNYERGGTWRSSAPDMQRRACDRFSENRRAALAKGAGGIPPSIDPVCVLAAEA